MTPAEARARFITARTARLATVRPDGAPHVVPVTFAVVGDVLVSAVDGKPKRSRRLQRIVNIEHEPRVSLLVDAWHERWSQLWWARADGVATVQAEPPAELATLVSRYPQYQVDPPTGPFLRVAVRRWSGWAAH